MKIVVNYINIVYESFNAFFVTPFNLIIDILREQEISSKVFCPLFL